MEPLIKPSTIAKWLTNDVLAVLNRKKKTLAESKMQAWHLVGLIYAVESGAITRAVARQILDEIV